MRAHRNRRKRRLAIPCDGDVQNLAHVHSFLDVGYPSAAVILSGPEHREGESKDLLFRYLGKHDSQSTGSSQPPRPRAPSLTRSCAKGGKAQISMEQWFLAAPTAHEPSGQAICGAVAARQKPRLRWPTLLQACPFRGRERQGLLGVLLVDLGKGKAHVDNGIVATSTSGT